MCIDRPVKRVMLAPVNRYIRNPAGFFAAFEIDKTSFF